MISRLGWGLAFTSCCLQAVCAASLARAGDAAIDARGALVLKPGVEFQPASYVHKKLPANTPLDPLSSVWVANLVDQMARHYGTATVNIASYSPPIYVAPADAPTVEVLAARASDPSWSMPALQTQWSAAPLPAHFTPAAGSDEEAIVYQPSTGRYWEFWLMERTGATTKDSSGHAVPQWRAAWGGEISNSSASRGYFPKTPQGLKLGTAATGLVLLGGVMTIAEQKRGVIEHALHIALPETRRGVWTPPAQRTDGAIADPKAIPQGATFRLPADLNLDQMDMDPYARMIARAVQDYGMVVRDTAGAVAFYAENPQGMAGPDPYWGRGGILNCPPSGPAPTCYPDSHNRLRGFPWTKLVALQTTAQP